MADLSEDELEPLFDYTRVQPVTVFHLDDESDSSPNTSPKRRKLSKSMKNNEEGNNKGGKTVEVIDCDDDLDAKENWLPPPPKNVAPSSKIYEDSIIRELRRKKEELASLVQTTELALRAAEEVASRELDTPIPSSTQGTTIEDIQELGADRTKIVISIQDKMGTKQYRVYADEKFELMFKGYAHKANIDVNKLVFCFDGDKIDPRSTPQSIGMEEDDIIEVHVKTS